MSRFREPISGGQAAAIIVSAIAYAVLGHLAGPIAPAQLLLVLVLLQFVVQPTSYLIHELGHGAVACRLAGGPANIVVGRGPWLRFSLGQIRVNFSLLPNRGVTMGGICTYRPAGVSWRGRAMISLAGPTATLLELVVGLGLGLAIWSGAGPFTRNLIAISLIALLASLIVNLTPTRLKRGRNQARHTNDGSQVLLALRMHRQGAPTPAAQRALPGFGAGPATRSTSATSAPRPQPQPQPQPAAGSMAISETLPLAPGGSAVAERRRDAERSRTSVPPPGA